MLMMRFASSAQFLSAISRKYLSTDFDKEILFHYWGMQIGTKLLYLSLKGIQRGPTTVRTVSLSATGEGEK